MLRSLCALAAVLLLAAGCEKPAAPPSNSTSTTPAASGAANGAADDAADDADADAGIADADVGASLDAADATDALAANTPADEGEDGDEAGDVDPVDDADGEDEEDEDGDEDDEDEPSVNLDPQPADEPAEGDAPKTAQDFMQEAQQKANMDDLDGALALIKAATEAEPENMDVLAAYCSFSLNVGYQQVQKGESEAGYAKMIQAAAAGRKLLDQEEVDERSKQMAAFSLFFEAAAHGHAEDAEKSLASLQEALDAGFDDHEMLFNQKELAFLKDNSEYQELVAPLIAKAEAAAAEEAAAAVEETKVLLAENEPFPFEFELKNVADGETVTNESLKGHVAIVDFWGTWCPPCRKEIPHFIALQDKYKDQGLVILGINCNEQGEIDEQTATVTEYMEANAMNYECVLSDGAVENRIPNLEGYPTTLFLDRSGTVRAKIVGYHSLPKLEAIVAALLAEPAEEAAPGETETTPDEDAAETDAAAEAGTEGDAAADAESEADAEEADAEEAVEATEE